MSYKLNLSDLKRDGDVSLTQQLVDRFVAAIESGDLPPGEKLPPTRQLATEVGVNHLTAARVYRKLAELGYVIGQGGPRHLRALARAGGQLGARRRLAGLRASRARDGLSGADARRRVLGGDEPGMLSLATGWPNPSTYPTEQLGRIAADVFAEEGEATLSYLPAEGLYPLREQVAQAWAAARVRHRPRRDRGHLRCPAGAAAGRGGGARAGRRGRDRVADASSVRWPPCARPARA